MIPCVSSLLAENQLSIELVTGGRLQPVGELSKVLLEGPLLTRKLS